MLFKSPILCSCSHSPARHSVSSMGQITGWEIVSWCWAVPPWGRADTGKVKLFFLPYPMCPLWFFFFLFSSVGVGPLPWTIRLPQRLCCLSRSDCLNHCSQGGGGVVPGPWPRGAGAGLQATSGSTARTEICMTVTIQMYVWLSLGPLTYGAGSRTKATWGCSWVLRGV